MEGLLFILKRFFYSFLAGCILNSYAIVCYFALKKAIEFPPFSNDPICIAFIKFSEDVIVSFLTLHANFVFVIIAILMSLFVEGICQMGIEKWFTSKDKKKRFDLWKYIFGKPSILQACKNYEKEQDNNPMKTFIYVTKDLKGKDTPWNYFPTCETYNALHICASVIERDNNTNDIYHYRDHSYILQMLRVTFLIIAILTIFVSIIILILILTNHGLFKSNDDCIKLSIFGGIIFFLSLLLFKVAGAMSYNFGRRYIRDVSCTYESLRYNLQIAKDKNVEQK